MSADLLHTYAPEEVAERVAAAWDLEAWNGFPKPKFTPRCSQCRSTEAVVRAFHFHHRRGKANPFRCDVMMKCTVCSWAWVFGVPVTKEIYARMKGKRYERAGARKFIHGA